MGDGRGGRRGERREEGGGGEGAREEIEEGGRRDYLAISICSLAISVSLRAPFALSWSKSLVNLATCSS